MDVLKASTLRRDSPQLNEILCLAISHDPAIE